MTDQEIARALEKMIREDGERPPEEQIQDLIDAGVIDRQGRILIGRWNKLNLDSKLVQQNSPSDGATSREVAGR